MSEPLYEMRDVGTSEDSLIELQKIEKHFGAATALAGGQESAALEGSLGGTV